MNIIDLLEKQIRAQGKDGLVNCELECGCKLGDLASCHEIRQDCEIAEEDLETAKSMGLDYFMRAYLPNPEGSLGGTKDAVTSQPVVGQSKFNEKK